MCNCNTECIYNKNFCSCKTDPTGKILCNTKDKSSLDKIECSKTCQDIECIKWLAENYNMYEYFIISNSSNCSACYRSHLSFSDLGFENFNICCNTNTMYYNLVCNKCNSANTSIYNSICKCTCCKNKICDTTCSCSCSCCTNETHDKQSCSCQCNCCRNIKCNANSCNCVCCTNNNCKCNSCSCNTCTNLTGCYIRNNFNNNNTNYCSDIDCCNFLTNDETSDNYYRNFFKELRDKNKKSDKSYDYRYLVIKTIYNTNSRKYEKKPLLYFFYKEKDDGSLTDHYLTVELPFEYLIELINKFKNNKNLKITNTDSCNCICKCGYYYTYKQK